MIDRSGRIICTKCASNMKAIQTLPDEAVFRCENTRCNDVASFRMKRFNLVNYTTYPSPTLQALRAARQAAG